MTLDEDLNPLEISVRVGQAVDTVGQAGKPKTITGFQTHTSPVLIAHGERVELATDDCKLMLPLPNAKNLCDLYESIDVSVSSFLENCVILKPNPDKKN